MSGRQITTLRCMGLGTWCRITRGGGLAKEVTKGKERVAFSVVGVTVVLRGEIV